MPNRNIFTLSRSGCNEFLFASIGTEAGGSRLTVLSALARLGEDPWAKAASWARMPEAACAAALAVAIAQMPVTPEDRLAAADTAARLIKLLSPVAVAASQQDSSGLPNGSRFITILSLSVCLAILLGAAILASH